MWSTTFNPGLTARRDTATRTNCVGREAPSEPAKPGKVKELLEVIVHGLRRAMHPLTTRRKGFQPLSFGNEYDVQVRKNKDEPPKN
jgi:hypothetical protein